MRSIEYATNYNNKLSTDCFVHITFEPKQFIPERLLSEPLLITVADEPSLRVKVITLDICRLKLMELRSIHTLPSHGILCYEFVSWWMNKYKNCSPETKLAIYYHKKVDI
jgi:hypothetical protein